MNRNRDSAEDYIMISNIARSKSKLDEMNGILEIIDYTPIRFAVIVEELYKNDIKLEDCSRQDYMRYTEGFMDEYNWRVK